MLPRIFIIYTVVILPACVLGNVPEKEFVSNGQGTVDKKLTEKHSPLIAFSPSIRFYRNHYDYVFVNYEGAISFGSNVSYDNQFCYTHSEFPLIAPFWMNASVKSGQVYYRQIPLGYEELEEPLSKPLNAIKYAFPAFVTSKWQQALVVTWHNVSRPRSLDQNSMLIAQAIIVTGIYDSRDYTFVVFFYDSVPHNASATAFLGFDSSNEGRFALQRSCVGDRIKVEVETNLNGPYQSGLWVYRVDTEIDEPGSLCPALTVPSYGYCRTNDYRVGDTARCGCNVGSEEVIMRCVKTSGGDHIWAGKLPECPVYRTTEAPDPETTTDGGSHSSSVSFLQTIPMLLLTFLVAFYLC